MKTTHFVLVAVVVAAGLVWATRRSPDPAEPPRESPPLDAIDVVKQRSAAKHAIACEVIDGRLSLLEAAARFRELNRVPPAAPYHPALDIGSPIRDPGQGEEEQLCRQVLAFVQVADLPPDRVAAAVDRLVAEFEAELCERGKIQLPDSPARP